MVTVCVMLKTNGTGDAESEEKNGKSKLKKLLFNLFLGKFVIREKIYWVQENKFFIRSWFVRTS